MVGVPISPSTSGAAPTCRNILDFEHDYPEAATVKLERNYRSTQIILDAASAVISQNRNRKDKHLWTDQKGGARIVYFRGGMSSKTDFITRTARGGLADDPETTAVLYRTNAQSRAIEDADARRARLQDRWRRPVLRTSRNQDALAYMRLVINPHDDVSLRRVINVPTRAGSARASSRRSRRSMSPRSQTTTSRCCLQVWRRRSSQTLCGRASSTG